ncbi:MAG: serine/threonine protein kinase [Candidatus Ancillula sp.]|jgi:serine/threonine-protein kinase|nr:serine/threonine protein kinase [Candidatus Ancillula sp.]
MKLTPGIIINNRYQLSEIIATGGMGEMWVGEDTILGRKVAIKALREENFGNEDFLQRLRIEARNNAMLTHPNIVALHDYYEDGNIGYIIMEYIEGESLAEILRTEPILPLERLLPILSQIAGALGYAHRNGIVHRDIKPANILIDSTGLVKIADFGVSKAVNQLNMTAAGMVVGTAQYLSPEQAIGDDATGASDLYALGVIAFEASQGKRPFGGKNAVDIAIAQVNNPVPPLSEETDPKFGKIVINLLEKNSNVRAVDGTKVAKQFDELLENINAEPEFDLLDAKPTNNKPTINKIASKLPVKNMHITNTRAKHRNSAVDKVNTKPGANPSRTLKSRSASVAYPKSSSKPSPNMNNGKAANKYSKNSPMKNTPKSRIPATGVTSTRHKTAKLMTNVPVKKRRPKHIIDLQLALMMVAIFVIVGLIVFIAMQIVS